MWGAAQLRPEHRSFVTANTIIRLILPPELSVCSGSRELTNIFLSDHTDGAGGKCFFLRTPAPLRPESRICQRAGRVACSTYSFSCSRSCYSFPCRFSSRCACLFTSTKNWQADDLFD